MDTLPPTAIYPFEGFTDGHETLEVRIEAGWDAAKRNDSGVYEPGTTLGFYFDAYYLTGPVVRHTVGIFKEEPSYADAKAQVQAILEGKVESTGGTLRKTDSTLMKTEPDRSTKFTTSG